MNKLANAQVTKGSSTDSYFHLFTAKFISKPIVPFLIKLGIHNPNVVSFISFIMILSTSALLLIIDQEKLMNRIIVVLLIEISFMLDCSDGQMARFLNKKSLYGAWLDRFLDRIGEMVLYTAIGYFSWLYFGSLIYLILGVMTGFLFSYYSLIHAHKDFVFYEELRKNRYQIGMSTGNSSKKIRERYKFFGKKYFKKNAFIKKMRVPFFFLHIGIGERYFYPIVFILLQRTDIMLIIVFTLFFLRAMNVTFILTKQIVRNKIGVKL